MVGSVSGSIRHYHQALRFAESNGEHFDFSRLTTGSFVLDYLQRGAGGRRVSDIKLHIQPSGL